MTALVHITLQGKLLLFLSIALGFLLLIYYFYKYTVPEISISKKLVLSLLRSVAVLSIILLIFEPILNFVRTIVEKPKVGVLIDNTQSILVYKNSENQREMLKNFLNSKKLENEIQNVTFEYRSFGNKVVKYQNFIFDSLDFSGEVTNIASAINELKKDNLDAVILISDGNYNSGKNPVYELENLNLPFYVIGVGDTTLQKDLMITKVQANKIAYVGNKIPVEVNLRWFGISNESVEITLQDDQEIISREIVKLDGDTFEKRIELKYEAKHMGVRKLNISVTPLSGELTEKNNYKNVYIDVLKSKIKVLIMAGAPSPDVSTIFNILLENQKYSVFSFVQKNADTFYSFFQDGKNEIKYSDGLVDTMDCVVFINFPTQVTSTNNLTRILNKIQDKKLPVLIVLGKDIDYSKLKNLDLVLPFTWSNYNPVETFIFPVLNEKSSNSILLSKDISLESFQYLPPIYKQLTQYRAKLESNVLVNIKGQAIFMNEPLFVSRNINLQKSFAILGYGLWRWKLLTQGTDNERFLNSLFTNIVDWLTIIDERKKIRVSPIKQTFTTADRIEFTAEVYNDLYQPIDNASLKVNVFSADLKYEILMMNVGNGRYEGSFENLKAGDYMYSGIAEMNGIKLGEDNGKFSVGKINIEYLDTRMNFSLLKQIAYRSGGEYLEVESIDELIKILSRIKFKAEEREIIKDIKLWTEEILGGLLIIVFVIEWYIRKRSGLL